MTRKCVIAIAAMIAAVALAPAAARAASSTATGRGITARLSWTGKFDRESDLALQITSGGAVVYSQPISSASCGTDCDVAEFSTHAPVHVVSLAGPSAPASVLVDLYTGGAHCCSIAQVFTPSSTGTWTVAEHNFGDPGYRVIPAGAGAGAQGTKVFQTADDTFAYAFTDYADSGMPIELLSLTGGRFVDVTARYPSLIKADAARWLAAYRQMAPKYTDTVGVLAAWTADEARLGNASLAFRFLRQQASLHRLNSSLTPDASSPAKYIGALRKLLAKRGYLK
jgi:hypothetical protein